MKIKHLLLCLCLWCSEKTWAQNWTPLAPESSLPDAVKEVFEKPNGRLIVACLRGKVYEWDGLSWTNISTGFQDNFLNANRMDFEMDAEGNLFASYEALPEPMMYKIQKFENNKWTTVFSTRSFKQNAFDLSADHWGNIRLATWKKIYKINGAAVDSLKAPADFFPVHFENSVLTNVDKNLICASTDTVLKRIDIWMQADTSWENMGSVAVASPAIPQLVFRQDSLKGLIFSKTAFDNKDQWVHAYYGYNNGDWNKISDSLGFAPGILLPNVVMDGLGNPLFSNQLGRILRYKNSNFEALPLLELSQSATLLSFPKLLFSNQKERLFALQNRLTADGSFGTVLYLDYPIAVEALQSGNLEMKVFPNPFDQEVLIADKHSNVPLRAVVSDILGKQVHEISFNTLETKKLNLEYLSPGVYVLTLQSSDGFWKYKIYKKSK